MRFENLDVLHGGRKHMTCCMYDRSYMHIQYIICIYIYVNTFSFLNIVGGIVHAHAHNYIVYCNAYVSLHMFFMDVG